MLNTETLQSGSERTNRVTWTGLGLVTTETSNLHKADEVARALGADPDAIFTRRRYKEPSEQCDTWELKTSQKCIKRAAATQPEAHALRRES